MKMKKQEVKKMLLELKGILEKNEQQLREEYPELKQEQHIESFRIGNAISDINWILKYYF